MKLGLLFTEGYSKLTVGPGCAYQFNTGNQLKQCRCKYKTLKLIQKRTQTLFSLKKKSGLLYTVNMKDRFTKKTLVTEDILTFAKAKRNYLHKGSERGKKIIAVN